MARMVVLVLVGLAVLHATRPVAVRFERLPDAVTAMVAGAAGRIGGSK